MSRFHFVVLSVLIFAPLACEKNTAVDTSDVDPIAEKILEAVAHGQAQSVYETYFTPEYQSNMTPEEWKQIAVGYQQLLGNVVSVKRLHGNARWIADQFIDGRVVYSVTWDKGDGNMTLDVTKDDGWKVSQLRIDSPKIEERVQKIKMDMATQPAN
jgi:hypothetical protein